MKTIIIVILVFLCFQNNCSSQNIIFQINSYSKNIISRDSLVFELSIQNIGRKKILIPKYPVVASFYQPESDVGFKLEYHDDSKAIKIDSCIALVLPILAEGNPYMKFKKKSIKKYIFTIPWQCLKPGHYKIQFVYKLQKFNKNQINVSTEWVDFEVRTDFFLPQHNL